MGLGGNKRKRNDEHGPAACGTLDPDRPVLRLNETAADGESEPDAPRASTARRLASVEGLEDALAVLLRHPVTVVAYGDQHGIVVPDNVDLHVGARFRVANRVLKQVVEDLLDSKRICENLNVLVG